MKSKTVCEQIENAGAWLPLTVVRQAFTRHEAVTPILFDAVRQRAAARSWLDIRQQRLAAFGLFFLAQHRDRRAFDLLVQLFESVDPEQQDEWLFANRLFFFRHRLLAGVCPLDARRVMDLALDAKLNPMTRSISVCGIGMLAACGDITRAEAVQRHRQLFKMVQNFRHGFMDDCWVRAAAKLHSAEFEHELQWFLASGRLDSHVQSIIAGAIRMDHEANFATMVALEPMVDIFLHSPPGYARRGGWAAAQRADSLPGPLYRDRIGATHQLNIPPESETTNAGLDMPPLHSIPGFAPPLEKIPPSRVLLTLAIESSVRAPAKVSQM